MSPSALAHQLYVAVGREMSTSQSVVMLLGWRVESEGIEEEVY